MSAQFSLQIAANDRDSFGKAQLRELFGTVGKVCNLELTSKSLKSGGKAVEELNGTFEYRDPSILNRACKAFDGLPIGSSVIHFSAVRGRSASRSRSYSRGRSYSRSRSRSYSNDASPPRALAPVKRVESPPKVGSQAFLAKIKAAAMNVGKNINPHTELMAGNMTLGIKIWHDLFIGNLPTLPPPSPAEVKDFLEEAMAKGELKNLKVPGPCVLNVRMAGKSYAFATMRTPEECQAGLDMHKIPFKGRLLNVKRPSRFDGPQDNHRTWPQVLEAIDKRNGFVSAESENLVQEKPFNIPDNCVGLLIGKGGATIKSLQHRTKCHIFIPKEPNVARTHRELKITGPKKGIERCCKEINVLIGCGVDSFAIVNQGLVDSAVGAAIGDQGVAGLGLVAGGSMLVVGGNEEYEKRDEFVMNKATYLEMNKLDEEECKFSSSLRIENVISSVDFIKGTSALKDSILAVKEECQNYGPIKKVKCTDGAIRRKIVKGLGVSETGHTIYSGNGREPAVYVQFHNRADAVKAKESLSRRTFDGKTLRVSFMPDFAVMGDKEAKAVYAAALSAVQVLAVDEFQSGKKQ